LVSSGKISGANLIILHNLGKSIEFTETPTPVIIDPVVPQNPFYRDRTGNKIFLNPQEVNQIQNIKDNSGLP